MPDSPSQRADNRGDVEITNRDGRVVRDVVLSTRVHDAVIDQWSPAVSPDGSRLLIVKHYDIGGSVAYLLGLLAGLIATVLLWISWTEDRDGQPPGRARAGLTAAAVALLLVCACTVVSLAHVAGGAVQLVLIGLTAVPWSRFCWATATAATSASTAAW